MNFQLYRPSLATVTGTLCVLLGASCGKSDTKPVADASHGPEAGEETRADTAADPGSPDAAFADVATCSSAASCDDGSPCTADSCDVATGQCIHVPLADGTSCQSVHLCATNSICSGGACLDGPIKTCTVLDQCHTLGHCDPMTGECTNPIVGGTLACDDGNPCTFGDRCQSGVCTGDPRVCPKQATCDRATGTCPLGGFPDPLSAWAFSNINWPGNDAGLVRDGAGNVFAAGAFFGETDLGTGAMNVAGTNRVGSSYTNVFLAQIDPSSTKAVWAQAYPGSASQDQVVQSFAVNGVGQLGVIGSLGGGSITVAGDEISQTRPGDQFVFVASSADGGGVAGWRLNLQNGDARLPARGVLRAIAGDPRGSSFVVCGNMVCGTGTAPAVDGGVPPSPGRDFAPSLPCAGGVDMVLARIGVDTPPDGGTAPTTLRSATSWATQIGGPNDEACAALAADAESNTYVAGTYLFVSDLTFALKSGATKTLPGPGTAPGPGGISSSRMFLAKLDSDNAWVWARSIGSDGQSVQPSAMIVVGADVVVAGTATGGSLLGVPLTSPAFVARLSGADGTPVWVQSFDAGSASAGIQPVSLSDVGGNILVAGTYNAACKIGGTPLPAPLSTGAFVAQLEGLRTGSVIAAAGYGDPGVGNLSTPVGILGRTDGAGDQMNSSLLLLNFTGNLSFGPPVGVLQAAAGTTATTCLAKLSP